MTVLDAKLAEYTVEHTAPLSHTLESIEREAQHTTINPHMVAGRQVGHLLQWLIKLSNAKTILDLGTFTGFSALCMAEAIPPEGRVYTIESRQKRFEAVLPLLKQTPHGHKVLPFCGKAIDWLDTTGVDLLFDFIFLDADKLNYPTYYETLIPKLKVGGFMVADNVLWQGKVLSPSRKDDHRMVAFNNLVQADDRTKHCMLPIRDGITIIEKIKD